MSRRKSLIKGITDSVNSPVYNTKICGKEYIEWVEYCHSDKCSILTQTAKDKLPHEVQKRIISHWSLPDNLHERMLSIPKVDKNNEIYEAIKDTPAPNDIGKEQFIREALFIADAGFILDAIFYSDKNLPPSELKRVFKKTKKLKSHLEDYLKQIKLITADANYFLQDYLSFSVLKEKDKHGVNPTLHFLNNFELTAEWICAAINEDSINDYIELLKLRQEGCGKSAANKKSIINALAESYYHCFGEMPTSSYSHSRDGAKPSFINYLNDINDTYCFIFSKTFANTEVSGNEHPNAIDSETIKSYTKDAVNLLKRKIR